MARWKWFDHDRRIQFEALLRAGHSKQEIAQLLGCHISTVYRELRNGDCLQRNHDLREYHVYSAYAADDRSRKRRRNRSRRTNRRIPPRNRETRRRRRSPQIPTP